MAEENRPKRQSTAEIAEELVAPIIEELGLQLWDVRFEKEGNQWYLRFFIDKDGGIHMDDCVEVNQRVSKLLDEEDPISQNYILEVGSPGLDRFLLKDEHFQQYIGSTIKVRLIRPVENRRNFTGELLSKDGQVITMQPDDTEKQLQFEFKEAAFVRVHFDFESGGN